MFDDTRLDGKLLELSKDLVARQMVPGFSVAEAFAMRGVDETGRPGLFAAILLAPGPAPELGTLTAFRQLLTQKLKQIDTRTPAWPIVVQGAPEVIDSDVVPGGPEYFEQVKLELSARKVKAPVQASPQPASKDAGDGRVPASKASKEVRRARKVPLPKATARRTAKRTAARTGRARRT